MKEKFSVRITFNLLTNVFNIFTNYLLVSRLSIGLFSIIAFTNTMILFFTMFISIGFEIIYTQHNADKNFNNYFSIFLLVKFILMAGSYIPLIIIIPFLNLEDLTFNFFILIIISNILSQSANPWLTDLECRKKIFKKEIILIISNLVKNILIISFILLFDKISNPLIFLGYIYITYSVFTFLFIIIAFRKDFNIKRIDMPLLKQFIQETKPLILLNIITSLVNNIGKILIGFSFGHEALAYYYFIDAYIIAMFLIISEQIATLFRIYFPENFINNDIKTVQFLTHKAEKYSSIFFLIIILLTFLHGELLITIFLPEFSNSIIYLYGLIFTPYFAGITRPYIAHVLSNKKQKLFSTYLIIKSIIFLFLKIVIIPKSIFSITTFGFGGVGLVFIMNIGWIVDIIFYRIFSQKMGIKPNKRIIIHLIIFLITIVISFPVSILLIKDIVSNIVIYFFLSSFLTICLFLFGLILSKELCKEDFKFFLNMFNLAEYKHSFIKELREKNSSE